MAAVTICSDFGAPRNKGRYINSCINAHVDTCVCLQLLSHVQLCDPMDCSPSGSSVHGFERQGHWSGLPCPPLRQILFLLQYWITPNGLFLFSSIFPPVATSWMLICSQSTKEDFELCNILSLRTAMIYLVISLCGHHF